MGLKTKDRLNYGENFVTNREKNIFNFYKMAISRYKKANAP